MYIKTDCRLAGLLYGCIRSIWVEEWNKRFHCLAECIAAKYIYFLFFKEGKSNVLPGGPNQSRVSTICRYIPIMRYISALPVCCVLLELMKILRVLLFSPLCLSDPHILFQWDVSLLGLPDVKTNIRSIAYGNMVKLDFPDENKNITELVHKHKIKPKQQQQQQQNSQIRSNETIKKAETRMTAYVLK